MVPGPGGWWRLGSWKSCQGLNDISSNHPGLMSRARHQSQWCGAAEEVARLQCEESYHLAQPSTRGRDGQMTVFKPRLSAAAC